MSNQGKWDSRFLALAGEVAKWSKDPSSKVGAVIVRPDNTVASLGFNGFPRGVADNERLDDRDTKLALTIHAEENAILTARERLDGCTIYVWPYPPCAPCAARIIQSGISRVVSPRMDKDHRWYASCFLGLEALVEAGVEVWWLDDVPEVRGAA